MVSATAQQTTENPLAQPPASPASQAVAYVSTVGATESTRAIVALVLARAGAIGEAEKIAKSLELDFPQSTLVQNFELPAIRAAVALHKNQPTQAIEMLKPALRYDFAYPNANLVLYPAYLRGIAYLKLGKGTEAGREFRKLVDHDGMTQDGILAPLSRLQLGRAQAMIGDKEAARKSYRDFLTLWKDADPDIPIYRQAKAEYAKLR